MTYNTKISSLIKTMNDQGLPNVASDLEEVRQATLTGLPFFEPTRRILPRLVDRPVSQHRDPSDTSIPFAKKGEPIIEIGPNGEEKIVLWGMNKPATKKELLQDIETGVITMERLTDQYSKGDSNVKKFLSPLIEHAKNKSPVPYNLSNRDRNLLRSKLAFIADKIQKCGYILLYKKIKTAMDEYEQSIKD